MNLGCTRFCSFVSAFQTDVSTDNLSASQCTLLRIHHRYGRTSMTDIRSWTKLGLYNLPIDIARCDIPICPACAFGLARKRKKESGSIGPDDPNPGDFVVIKQLPRVQFQKLRDLMMCWTPLPTDPFPLTNTVP